MGWFYATGVMHTNTQTAYSRQLTLPPALKNYADAVVPRMPALVTISNTSIGSHGMCIGFLSSRGLGIRAFFKTSSFSCVAEERAVAPP